MLLKSGSTVQLIPGTEDCLSDNSYYSIYLGIDLTVSNYDFNVDGYIFLEETLMHPFTVEQLALKIPKNNITLQIYSNVILWDTKDSLYIRVD